MIDIFEIGTVKRLPLGTDYNNVVSVMHNLMGRGPIATELVIDGTGIGKPVADMFRFRGITPWCITATAGIEQTIDRGQRTANVPKLMLISRIQSLLFEGRLKIHAEIPDVAAFLEELRDFRVEYSASGHMTYNAKSGRHDDMIAAAAVAAWRLSRVGGWGPPSEHLAALALGIATANTFSRARPWVIGLDLGKVNDPTAIVVMRRASVESSVAENITGQQMTKARETAEREAERLADEAAKKLADMDNRVVWRKRFDEMASRATPNHPEVGVGSVQYVNGPNCSSEYSRGSVEYAEQQRTRGNGV